MRNLFLIIMISLFACACNNAAQPVVAVVTDTVQAMPAASKAAVEAGAVVDPVCEMPWDTSWTDITVYQQDTLKFCSEGCKKAFLARPAKYTKGKAGKNI